MKMNAKMQVMSKTPKFKIITGSNPALAESCLTLVHCFNPGLLANKISFTKVGSQFTVYSLSLLL